MGNNTSWTITTTPNTGGTFWINGANTKFTVCSSPNYSFGFTGWHPVPTAEPDPFDVYVEEVRRLAELEESVQGS